MSRWIPRVAAVFGLLALGLAGPAAGQDNDGAADAADGMPTERERLPSSATAGQQRLAQTLLAKERALDRRERTLGQRQRDLEDAEKSLTAKVEELTEVRVALQELLDRVDALENEKMAKARKLVGGMRDKSAAAVLTEMDRDLAVQVLDGMNARAAAAAMAKMDPKLAADLANRLTRPIRLPGGRP